MSTQQQILKQGDLLNRLVLERSTAEEVGRVSSLWLNSVAHQVVGLTCKSGFLGNKKHSFAWEQVTRVGADSILVNNTSDGAEPEKPEQVVSLIGHEVWTDAGNKVGKLVDYLFESETGAVVSYLFVSSGWRGVLDGVYLLPIVAIASIGSKRVIVADAIVQVPTQYAEGLNQKVNQATELLKDDLEKTKRDIEAVKNRTQNLAEQVKDKTQEITEKAKEKVSEVKDQLQKASEPVPEVKTIDTTVESITNVPELPENTDIS